MFKFCITVAFLSNIVDYSNNLKLLYSFCGFYYTNLKMEFLISLIICKYYTIFSMFLLFLDFCKTVAALHLSFYCSFHLLISINYRILCHTYNYKLLLEYVNFDKNS